MLPIKVLVIALLVLLASCRPFPVPPRWKGRPDLLYLWSESTIVAAGQLTSVRRIGRPIALVAPANNAPFTLYPCEGEFLPTAFVKGGIDSTRPKILLFSWSPRCSFGGGKDFNVNPVERIWFLRQEDEWLRPIIDTYSGFLDLFEPFEASASIAETQARFARALLSPKIVAKDPAAFFRRLPEFYELSCQISGSDTCFANLRHMQQEAQPPLRAEICRWLASQFDQCNFTDCPASTMLDGGIDMTNSAELDLLRKAHALSLTSEEPYGSRVNPYRTLSELRRLACNYDPIIQKRARKLLRKYFPAEVLQACIPCK